MKEKNVNRDTTLEKITKILNPNLVYNSNIDIQKEANEHLLAMTS